MAVFFHDIASAKHAGSAGAISYVVVRYESNACEAFYDIAQSPWTGDGRIYASRLLGMSEANKDFTIFFPRYLFDFYSG